MQLIGAKNGKPVVNSQLYIGYWHPKNEKSQ